jgi:hypothetical protein
MQTDIEKFDLINQYLKGKLSEGERIQFEAEIGADSEMQSEIEMHRLLNDTIVDNYLLGVKQTTKQVFQQKKTYQNRKNWTIGLSSIFLIGTIFVAYNQLDQHTVTKKISLTTEKLQTTKPNQENLNQTTSKPKTESKKDLNSIKEPTKPNYISNEPSIEKAIETKAAPKTIEEELSISNSEHVKTEKPITKSEQVNTTKIEASPKAVEKSEKLLETKLREDVQLILNLSQNEPVIIPIEEGFDGKIEILNGNGVEIWLQNIVGGQPNTWDGIANSGGQVSSGQYAFILKSNEGQIVKHGFIMVVR